MPFLEMFLFIFYFLILCALGRKRIELLEPSAKRRCTKTIFAALLLLLTRFAVAQEYTATEVFKNFNMWSPPSLTFGRNGSIFLILKGDILRSTDGGTTWAKASIDSLRFNSIFINSKTGDLFSKPVGRDGVWRSTDSGRHWLKVSPDSVRIDFVVGISSTTGSIFLQGQDNREIWRSTDNGAHWQRVLRHSKYKNTISTFDNFGVLFLALSNEHRWRKTQYHYWGDGYYFYSSDDGVTWNGLKCPLSIDRRDELKYLSGVMSNGNHAILFAPGSFPNEKEKDAGVFTTTNNGKSWAINRFLKHELGRPHDDKHTALLTVDSLGRLYFGIDVLADKTHRHELTQNTHQWYISQGVEIYRSDDHGRNWSPFSTLFDDDGRGEWGLSLKEMKFDRNGFLYLSTQSGVYCSQDGGKSYKKVLEDDGGNTNPSLWKDPNGYVYSWADGQLHNLTR